MNGNDLDDPRYARFAWSRYRRIMAGMTLASLAATALGLGALHWAVGPMPMLATIFAGGGIFFSLLLGTALMGLVFLSSGTGHDERIEDPTADDWNAR